MKLISSEKTRDIYDLGNDKCVIVNTDRVAAYNQKLPTPVEGKGKMINAISSFWNNHTKNIVQSQVITNDPKFLPPYFNKPEFAGRAFLAKKLKLFPFDFVVRGYIFGKMWEAHEKNEEFCGEKINPGLVIADKLEKPMLTVSTINDDGEEEYVSFWRVAEKIDVPMFNKIKEICFSLYETCYNHASKKGIIIADTKFRFGVDDCAILCAEGEIFTPDTSRYWNKADYMPGKLPKSYDKHLIHDWLEQNKVDGKMQFDAIPDEIYAQTSELYRECMRKLLS